MNALIAQVIGENLELRPSQEEQTELSIGEQLMRIAEKLKHADMREKMELIARIRALSAQLKQTHRPSV